MGSTIVNITLQSAYKLYILLLIAFLANVVLVSAQKNRKEEKQLTEKYNKLLDLSIKETVLQFNGNRFREFARSSPRNYSMIIMFTALTTARRCIICKEVAEEYQVVADSFRRRSHENPGSNEIFFAMVDFDKGADVFQVMNIEQAPVFIHFPAKGRPKKVDNMDLSRVGYHSEAIAKFVAERTGVHIRVVKPPNYRIVGILSMITFLIGCIIYLRRDNLEFLQNPKAWGILIVGFVIIMMSGQMWNSIRGPPIAQKSSSGVEYIHENAQMQYVLESYIIIMLYGGIVVGVIMMTDASFIKGNVTKRRTFSVIGLALMAFFYSLMLSLFRSKAEGYPFSFLLK